VPGHGQWVGTGPGGQRPSRHPVDVGGSGRAHRGSQCFADQGVAKVNLGPCSTRNRRRIPSSRWSSQLSGRGGGHGARSRGRSRDRSRGGPQGGRGRTGPSAALFDGAPDAGRQLAAGRRRPPASTRNNGWAPLRACSSAARGERRSPRQRRCPAGPKGDGPGPGQRNTFLSPAGGDDGDATVRQAAYCLTEPPRGGGIGEMDVVDDEHQRLAF